jgi:hypothetical protein
MDIRDLTGIQLHTAMLTLRLAGHDDAANAFQTELTNRAERAVQAQHGMLGPDWYDSTYK